MKRPRPRITNIPTAHDRPSPVGRLGTGARRGMTRFFDSRGFRASYVALCSVVLAFVSWHHEPWADEAQAWLLAETQA
jgi:hypothetical protein